MIVQNKLQLYNIICDTYIFHYNLYVCIPNIYTYTCKYMYILILLLRLLSTKLTLHKYCFLLYKIDQKTKKKLSVEMVKINVFHFIQNLYLHKFFLQLYLYSVIFFKDRKQVSFSHRTKFNETPDSFFFPPTMPSFSYVIVGLCTYSIYQNIHTSLKRLYRKVLYLHI